MLAKNGGVVLLRENTTRKRSFFKNRLEESKILFVYRYISLLITSAFYLFNHPEHEITRKVIIIGCLTIAAIILSYLYLIYENSNKNIKLLLLIETIGNTVLLIPSGGINSPFIWYTLNTILISSVFLNKKYCWINLFAYLFGYLTIIYFSTNIDIDILKFVKNESNLLLSFIMIIVAVQAWSIFVKKTKEKSKRLEEVNIQLELANEMIIESMDHIKVLYQTVNILTNQGNKEGLINVLFEHIRSITKSNTVFYYDMSADINKIILDGDSDLLETLEESIMKNLDSILEFKIPREISVSGSRFLLITVRITHVVYGILGLEVINSKESLIYKNKVYQLLFLSEIISVAFERLSLEEINHRLLITEEQNRIANEIHDSVLQRLFSMSCGVFALIKKLDKYSKDDIEKELNLFRKTTNSAMKELRDKIYGLSWKKSGYNSFCMDIKKYLDDIEKMNTVNIPFIINGSDEILSYKQKKALYRIICEGVGNAFRHGQASNIEVRLNIDSHTSILNITDDGIGFDLLKVNEEKSKGVGLENIYQLTESLHGEIKIDTKLGYGTCIEVILPNNVEAMKGAEAI